ncbi:hypothetical protein GOBAR_AA22573 [Gossypium barbadense]|uniref:Uncharacterized protein n=1 Tax=Gossypium barbadense TaxID=3634 RepID=A0A2P5X424_GOSBA|nr:hypothetical protein GOBAR_AA22573 [Gossypium barbadense]
MKSKNEKKRGTSATKGCPKGKKFSLKNDPFFETESKKRRKMDYEDDDIESGGSEEEAEIQGASDGNGGEDENEIEETPEIAYIVECTQLRLKKPETADGFRVMVKHRHTVTAVALSDDDLKGFSASKDGTILQWDVESGKTERYQWPSEDILKSHGAKDPRGRLKKHSKSVLALAVSSDGRYLASGGLDRHVHLWDIRTREHLQVLDQSRLVFRPPPTSLECCCFINNDEFLSGSDDGSIQLWNVLRKKPVYIVKNAHALLPAGQNVEQKGCENIPDNCLENGDHKIEGYNFSSTYSWVSSISVCRGSDLAASGAGNGCVRLWAIETGRKDIQPLYDVPLQINPFPVFHDEVVQFSQFGLSYVAPTGILRSSKACGHVLSLGKVTTDLFSGSFDRTIKYWNMEDRAYIDTICGHESEVLTLDCLRKERVLTVGRDRCMMLFKAFELSIWAGSFANT